MWLQSPAVIQWRCLSAPTMWCTKREFWLQHNKRLVSLFSLWSLGAGGLSLYHCPTSPVCHPLLVVRPAIFTQQVGCKGVILCFLFSTPCGWWCGSGRAAFEQICWCCRGQKLIKNPALAICLTVLSWFAQWKNYFSFSSVAGKKGLRELYIFRAVLNRRSCKIPINEIYITCIARL